MKFKNYLNKLYSDVNKIKRQKVISDTKQWLNDNIENIKNKMIKDASNGRDYSFINVPDIIKEHSNYLKYRELIEKILRKELKEFCMIYLLNDTFFIKY